MLFRSRMAKELQITDSLYFAKKVEEFADKTTHAPFCIDYELFAQYMYGRERGAVVLGRWSNISMRRSTYLKFLNHKIGQVLLSRLFHSISLHSWAETSI